MSIKRILSKKLVALGLTASAALSAGYLIIPYEGEVRDKQGYHVVYKDPVGILTYCWGITGKDMYGKYPRLGDRYTDQECITMFADKLRSFERDLDRMVRVDYASPYQRAALISFVYNVGAGNMQSSTLLKKLNAGDHTGACQQLTRWVYAQKVKLPGLVTRRSEEMDWCLGNVSDDVKVDFEDILALTKEIKEKQNVKK